MPSRPSSRRRRARFVRLTDVPKQVRVAAARNLVRADPQLHPTERLQLALLAKNPPVNAGGWVAE